MMCSTKGCHGEEFNLIPKPAPIWTQDMGVTATRSTLTFQVRCPRCGGAQTTMRLSVDTCLEGCQHGVFEPVRCSP